MDTQNPRKEGADLDLTCGLEIHQQLDTRQKLFCRCATAFQEVPLEGGILRKFRAVAGETGEVDAAAQHESLRNREFFYKLYPAESCLVETDSEPPHPLNPEAVDIALEIALLLGCTVPAEIHVMRKNVIDGSNTSGFQRTAIVGLNGSIATSFGAVRIPAVAVEEDSAQILSKEGRKIFGLNRLGIPLVEIATAPDIHTPAQGKEVAEKIGMVLRSSRVKRGLGTIRQDLNISVSGGKRVELKGVQDLKAIPLLIEQEARRQLALAAQGSPVQGEVRKAEPDGSSTFLRPLPGAARLYPETDLLPVPVPAALVARIRAQLPELLGDKRARLEQELGVPQATIKSLEKAGRLPLFQQLAALQGVHPPFAATILLSLATELPRRDPAARPDGLAEASIREVFQAVADGKVPKDAVLDLLAQMAAGKHPSLARGAAVDLDQEVRALLQEKPGLTFAGYMGLLMARLKGKVSGEQVSQALQKVKQG